MPEFDDLPPKYQEEIEELLWEEATYPKDVAIQWVEDWISNNNDPDLSIDEWLERAKRASFYYHGEPFKP